MSDFWTSEEKIPIAQTKVSVPAEHGLNYDPGQKIEFQIPAGIGFFQPKESYLKFDVELSGPTTAGRNTRLQLDQQLGGQVLIRDIRVYSGGAGRILLEEFQNYNVLTAVKYDYETNDSIKSKRALTEGTTVYNERTRSTTGMETGDYVNDIHTNPYFPAAAVATGTTAFPMDTSFQKVKCLLPLNTGIFSNDRIFPVGQTDGLVIEIILEDAKRCVKTIDTVNRYRKVMGNPVFLTDHSASNVAPLYPAAHNSSAFTVFYVRRDNLMGVNATVGTSNFPFVVGEEFKFLDVNSGQLISSQATGSTEARIAGIAYIAGVTNAIRITVAGTTGFRPSHAMSLNCVMVSTAVEDSVADYAPSYTITDCEMIVQKVTMTPGYMNKLASQMKSGGVMNYDFLSWTNYKIAQGSTEVVTTLRPPLNESRAKCVLAVPTDSTVMTIRDHIIGKNGYVEYYSRNATDAINAVRSNRTNIVGIADEIQDYQMYYDGKLNPNRKVSVAKTSGRVSVSAQPLIELEKALVMGGITPYSMLAFQRNFVIGRALSLDDGVYDARGKDFQIQLEYTGTAPSFNKLWNVWCGHLRRIVISGDSIALER